MATEYIMKPGEVSIVGEFLRYKEVDEAELGVAFADFKAAKEAEEIVLTVPPVVVVDLTIAPVCCEPEVVPEVVATLVTEALPAPINETEGIINSLTAAVQSLLLENAELKKSIKTMLSTQGSLLNRIRHGGGGGIV